MREMMGAFASQYNNVNKSNKSTVIFNCHQLRALPRDAVSLISLCEICVIFMSAIPVVILTLPVHSNGIV